MKRKLVSLGTKELKKIRGGKNDANACDDTVDGGTLDTVVVVGTKPSK